MIDSSKSAGENRRQFLRNAASGVLATTTLASPFIGSLRADSHSKRKLGFALVGLGNLATNQIAPALSRTKHCRLAGIVSGTPSKIEKWKRQYALPDRSCYSYETYDRIADNPDIDVIYILLPNSMHAEYSIRAAHFGKHVLCEKPMANSAKDCQEMIAACEMAKRKLAIGYRCQFEPHHLHCMDLAQKESFGKIKMIEAGFGFKIGNPNQWRLKHQYAGGGALMDVGIYALQACRYLSGEQPVEISAMETKTDAHKFAEVDESMTWTMKFANGINCYCSTTYAFGGINHFNVYCENGNFGLDPAFSYSGISGKTSRGDRIDFEDKDQFAAEMDDFAECILEDRKSRVSGEEGLADLKVIEAIYKSIRTGKTIRLS